MSHRVSNFSDLIQRVAASCLLHPLAAGRQDSGEAAGNGREDCDGEEEEEEEEEEVCEEGEGEGGEEYVEEDKKGRLRVWERKVERVMEMEVLMSDVFDAVSAMKRAYISLQEAHCPWDPERMRVADVAVVGELRRLAVLKERYRRRIGGGGGGGRRGGAAAVGMLREVVAPYEAAVEDLKRLVKAREADVENLKEKLKTATSLSNGGGGGGGGGGKKGRYQSRRKVSCSQGQGKKTIMPFNYGCMNLYVD